MKTFNTNTIEKQIGIFLIWIFIILISIASIAVHEHDLSRNFQKYGDAKAWFFPIKIDK